MSNPELIERMTAAGVSSAEAEDIAKSFPAVAPDDEIDVDRLAKAMQDVADTFQGTDDTTDTTVEDVVAEATSIVDAVTKGADALLAEQREQYESLSKGFLALAEEVKDLRASVNGSQESLSKAIDTREAISSEPLERRSVTTEIIPAPGETATGSEELDHRALINKALEGMQDDSVPNPRKAELRKAVSLLESGMPANLVQSNFRL